MRVLKWVHLFASALDWHLLLMNNQRSMMNRLLACLLFLVSNELSLLRARRASSCFAWISMKETMEVARETKEAHKRDRP